MIMKRFAWLLLVVALWTPTVEAQKKKVEPPPLRAWCDRDDALYKRTTKATFYIQSVNDGEATWQLSDDGFVILDEGKITLEKDKRYSLMGTLPKAGFLQLRVTQGSDKAYAAAAFDPTKIVPTAKMPDDFDDFWAAGLKELAAVPINAQLTLSKEYTEKGKGKYACYKITLDNIDKKKVHGWITVPANKGKFPAILTVPGAGVYGIGPDVKHAELGALSMNIIIHDIPVDETKAFYAKQSAGPLKDYRDMGVADKNKNYYRAVILGCVRCLDYLTSRPDYNGKDLAVTGGSQGGALTLIVSGLDPRVKLAAPNVAAMCDHSGFAHKRVGGWPHWLNRFKDKDKADKVLETSAYYDAVNFARKFKGKSVHGVGFIDTVCAPTTVYAAYNVHPEPKTMINSPTMGHGTDPRWLAAREAFWKANMELRPPK
jgi:cephalosporin-C deacetylase-like acetyl esterase